MEDLTKMSIENLCEKINYYSKKAKENSLTQEEKADREKYRNEYRRRFRISMKNKLSGIEIVEKDN